MIAAAGVADSDNAGTVAFVVATAFESRCVQRGLKAVARANAACIRCGIGCHRKDALLKLSRFQCIVSTGFAAGLQHSAATGTLLIPGRIQGIDGKFRNASPEWHARIRDVLEGFQPLSSKPLIHVDEIVATPGAKRALGADGKLAGADMESALIADACEAQGIPFVTMRVVLDPVDATVPDAISAGAVNGTEPRALELLAALARRPGDLHNAFIFAGYIMKARQILTQAISQVTGALAASAHT